MDRLIVKDRPPPEPSIAGFPDSSAGSAGIVGHGVSGDPDNRNNPVPDRADVPVAKLAVELRGNLLANHRSCNRDQRTR